MLSETTGKRLGRPPKGRKHFTCTLPPSVISAIQQEAYDAKLSQGDVVTRWHDKANNDKTVIIQSLPVSKSLA